MVTETKINPADVFGTHGGQLRMAEALALGLSRHMLYALRDRNIITSSGRGIWRLTELPPPANPDLLVIGKRIPHAVVSLISALTWHNMTTQIPHRVSIAIPRKSRIPTLDHPPLDVHKFSQLAYENGIEEHMVDGVTVKIYSPEKTLADCFKFRNKIGMDIVLESLKLYKARKPFQPEKLLEYARICRVENVMRPYLEASL
jgi:predicted transcriptional regulator of viral defense system